MAVEILLKLPGVEGESQTKGHEKEIDIMAFAVGASNPSNIATGGGAGAGKVDITSLTLQKQVDMSSVKLFTNCCKGTHFDNAVMTVREAGGDAPLEYYVINLKQVFIDNMHWDGSTGAGKPTESVSISFAEFKITYRQQSKTGGEDKKDELGWNLKTNAAAA